MNEPKHYNDEHKINSLEKELYERDFKNDIPSVRQHFTEKTPDAERVWQHDLPGTTEQTPAKAPKVVAGSFFKKILISSLIFFVLSAGLLVYMFLGGWNIISSNNVEITFFGPINIAAGDELNFEIVIDNQNRAPIESAVIHVNYPDGTKQVDDITTALTYDKFDVGAVASKETARRTSRSVLFGELNAEKGIKVAVEYKVKNSNATFRKEKTYDLKISSTPVTIKVIHPEKAISNDSVEFKAEVTSNSSAPLTNLLLKLDYPFGFTYSNATPAPNYDSNYWLIPTLNPGEKKEFSIIGQIQGEHNDERVFHFTLGAQDEADERTIATQYLTEPESIFIQRPPLAISLEINGSSTPTYVTQQGERLSGKIEIVNNLNIQIVDPVIVVDFAGALFDKTSVRVTNGFFESQNNKIVYDKNTNSNLATLDPGKKVSLSFNFATLENSTTPIKNGTMSLNARVSGQRVSETDLTNTVGSSLSRTFRTKTSIGLLSQIVYSTGPFRNKGPIPPKVEEKTTYTVIWTTTNTSNDVRGAEVRARLPNYVRWLDVSSPTSENIAWNSATNEVIWRVGDIVSGTGTTRPARQVSFQIEFTPSASQAGTRPLLVDDILMTAIDSFTNVPLKQEVNRLNTSLTNDPKYTTDEDLVVQ